MCCLQYCEFYTWQYVWFQKHFSLISNPPTYRNSFIKLRKRISGRITWMSKKNVASVSPIVTRLSVMYFIKMLSWSFWITQNMTKSCYCRYNVPLRDLMCVHSTYTHPFLCILFACCSITKLMWKRISMLIQFQHDQASKILPTVNVLACLSRNVICVL